MSKSPDGGARRSREAAFHDGWAETMDPATTLVDEAFTALTAMENKHVLATFGDLAGKRILDHGCGGGEAAVYFAKLGAHAVGTDVSPGMLAAAQRLAAHHGVAIETRLVTDDRIPADDDEFDHVYGNGVLHHVDLDRARFELARTLSPLGSACFIEPLAYNPVIEIYRRLADTVRTPDEKPLRMADLDRFRESFAVVGHTEFWLLTLSVFLKFFLVDRADPAKERYWKKVITDADRVAWFFRPLQRADEVVLGTLPFLGRLCWNTVLTVSGPIKGVAR